MKKKNSTKSISASKGCTAHKDNRHTIFFNGEGTLDATTDMIEIMVEKLIDNNLSIVNNNLCAFEKMVDSTTKYLLWSLIDAKEFGKGITINFPSRFNPLVSTTLGSSIVCQLLDKTNREQAENTLLNLGMLGAAISMGCDVNVIFQDLKNEKK